MLLLPLIRIFSVSLQLTALLMSYPLKLQRLVVVEAEVVVHRLKVQEAVGVDHRLKELVAEVAQAEAEVQIHHHYMLQVQEEVVEEVHPLLK